MNAENSARSFGLLFALLCIVIGIIGIASTRKTSEHSVAHGIFMQAIILVFVVAGKYFDSSVNLYLGGLIVVGLLIIKTFIRFNDLPQQEPHVGNDR